MWPVPHVGGSAPIGKRLGTHAVNGGLGAFPIRYRAISEDRFSGLRHPAKERGDQLRHEDLGVRAPSQPGPHVVMIGMRRVTQRPDQRAVPAHPADVHRWAGPLALQAHRVALVRVGRPEPPPRRRRAPTSPRGRTWSGTAPRAGPPRPAGHRARRAPAGRRADPVRHPARRRSRMSARGDPTSPSRAGSPGAAGPVCSRRAPGPAATPPPPPPRATPPGPHPPGHTRPSHTRPGHTPPGHTPPGHTSRATPSRVTAA
jgi:hypothetical protein